MQESGSSSANQFNMGASSSGRKKPGRPSAWSPDSSFRAYGEHMIADRIAKMLSYAREVRRGTDPEAVHDMRVASRRLRAALSVFEPAFRHPEYDRLQKEVKQVTASLSRARDLVVMIEEITREAGQIPASQRGVMSDIVRKWSVERRRTQNDVVAALDRMAQRDMSAMFDRARSAVNADSAPEAGDDAPDVEPQSQDVAQSGDMEP